MGLQVVQPPLRLPSIVKDASNYVAGTETAKQAAEALAAELQASETFPDGEGLSHELSQLMLVPLTMHHKAVRSSFPSAFALRLAAPPSHKHRDLILQRDVFEYKTLVSGMDDGFQIGAPLNIPWNIWSDHAAEFATVDEASKDKVRHYD